MRRKKLDYSDRWISFTSGNHVKTDKDRLDLPTNLPYKVELKPKDLDKVAKQGAYRFKQGEITIDQLASILDVRAMVSAFGNIDLCPLSELNETVKKHFLKDDINEWDHTISQINPIAEQYYVSISLTPSKLSDPRIIELLVLAHYLNVIYLDDLDRAVSLTATGYTAQTDEPITFKIPSVSARTVFNNKIYGDDAKKLITSVGVFTLDDIERSVRENSRYAVFSFPGIPDTTEFHEVLGPIFYMCLHDELHRRLVSSIPNYLYQPYFKAIDLVRRITGFHWSKELWNAIDLEVGRFPFLKSDSEKTPQSVTKNFEVLLNEATFSTQEKFGLFSAEDCCLDTLLILMMDLVKNEQEWKELKIEPEYFANDYYKNIYQFVKNNDYIVRSALREPVKIAILKESYLQHEKNPNFLIALPDFETFKTFNIYHFEQQSEYIQVANQQHEIIGESKAKQLGLAKFKGTYEKINHKLKMNTDSLTEVQKKFVENAIQVAQVINTEIETNKNTLSAEEISHYTRLLDTTDLLVRDPSNKQLQKKYETLVASTKNGQPTFYKNAKSILLGFINYVKSRTQSSRNNPQYPESMLSLQNNIRLFKSRNSSGVYKTVFDFKSSIKIAI